MREKYTKFLKFLEKDLSYGSRILLLLSVIMLVFVLILPLWKIQLDAQQFPEGLEVFIYSYKLSGGGLGGNDLNEINILNHYIGMAELKDEDFTEFKWIPLAIGLFIIFTLRTAVIGKVRNLVDLSVLFTYFGLFSMSNFYYKLYYYGHNLDPRAAITVEPYTPPIIGSMQLANFTVISMPSYGGTLMVLFLLVSAACLIMNYQEFKSEVG